MDTCTPVEAVVRLGFYDDSVFVPICDTWDAELAHIVARNSLARWEALSTRWAGTARAVVFRSQADRLRGLCAELGLVCPESAEPEVVSV